jgi:hypothetical protein
MNQVRQTTRHSREDCPREGGERESTPQPLGNGLVTYWIPAFAGMTVAAQVSRIPPRWGAQRSVRLSPPPITLVQPQQSS